VPHNHLARREWQSPPPLRAVIRDSPRDDVP
jgi:hypothetical protein